MGDGATAGGAVGRARSITQDPADLQLIQQLYEITGELGRGGMGWVFSARDLETAEIVALKVLKPDIADDPRLIARFKDELRLARRISHRNVCRTHELMRFGGTTVIAMEFVDGQSLRSLIRSPAGVSLRKAS